MDRSPLPDWQTTTPHPERPALTPIEATPAGSALDRLFIAALGLSSAALLLRACLPS